MAETSDATDYRYLLTRMRVGEALSTLDTSKVIFALYVARRQRHQRLRLALINSAWMVAAGVLAVAVIWWVLT